VKGYVLVMKDASSTWISQDSKSAQKIKCKNKRGCYHQKRNFLKVCYFSCCTTKHQIDKCDIWPSIQFKDSLFYDISAWSFDLAFNLNFESVNTLDNAVLITNQIWKRFVSEEKWNRLFDGVDRS
jgi:hypothetical protein